jgi:hypothetical protein
LQDRAELRSSRVRNCPKTGNGWTRPRAHARVLLPKSKYSPMKSNGSAYGDRTRFVHFVTLRDSSATFRYSARYCNLSKITSSQIRAELRSSRVRK